MPLSNTPLPSGRRHSQRGALVGLEQSRLGLGLLLSLLPREDFSLLRLQLPPAGFKAHRAATSPWRQVCGRDELSGSKLMFSPVVGDASHLREIMFSIFI